MMKRNPGFTISFQPSSHNSIISEVLSILYIVKASLINTIDSRMLNCAIIHDLVAFAKLLEVALGKASEIMELLKPTFTLVGSIPEGTRIGIANELDITINFEGWRDNPPLLANIDGVHLFREGTHPIAGSVRFGR